MTGITIGRIVGNVEPLRLLAFQLGTGKVEEGGDGIGFGRIHLNLTRSKFHRRRHTTGFALNDLIISHSEMVGLGVPDAADNEQFKSVVGDGLFRPSLLGLLELVDGRDDRGAGSREADQWQKEE